MIFVFLLVLFSSIYLWKRRCVSVLFFMTLVAWIFLLQVFIFFITKKSYICVFSDEELSKIGGILSVFFLIHLFFCALTKKQVTNESKFYINLINLKKIKFFSVFIYVLLVLFLFTQVRWSYFFYFFIDYFHYSNSYFKY